jgi:hypothetical protein
MTLLFATISFGGFCAALAAHLATLCGIDVIPLVPRVFMLQFGIFVLVVPLALYARTVRGGLRIDGIRGYALALLFVYALVHLIVAIWFSPDGLSTSLHLGWFTTTVGTNAKHLTDAEQHRAQIAQVREFSAGWMLFYFMWFALFMAMRKLRARSWA